VTDIVEVSTLAGDRQDASMLAYSAVTARLAATAHVTEMPVSVYWHRGEVGEAVEWRVTFQTTAERYEALAAHLLERHPRPDAELWATGLTAPRHHADRITETVGAG
jgi:periplasmic divalent cation tolerance protein